MLLNIIDYDPRSKKRPSPRDGATANDSQDVSGNNVATEVTQKKRKLVGPAAVQAAASSGQSVRVKKTSLKPVDRAQSKAASAAASHGTRDGAVPASAAKSSHGAVGGNKLAFSGDEQNARKPQEKRHRQQSQSGATADNDIADWASVADCLLDEVRDVEKLFQEQLDMDARTADTDKVFSKFAIKDCKDIHPYLVSLLTEKLGLEYFTNVQAETLPLVLSGQDVLIKTQTGSGKSLALLLPLVQQLQSVQPPLSRSSGVQALVLCPTHELAEQSQQLLQNLLRPFVRIVSGQLVGGVKRKAQKAALRRGLNILVATPRRLLDHLERSSRLDLAGSLRMLVIDEADRLAELGYERDVRRIVEAACAGGRRPQTLLCSATLSSGAERLAGLALSQPASVTEEAAMPASVRHHVLAAPTRMRLRALLSVVRALLAARQKAALFLPTQASVDFHHALLSTLLSDSVPLCRLHGKLGHADRMRAFRQFAAPTGCGLLVTTDVSARGLDLSGLSWVLQGPGEPELYCHRAGRTARLGRPGRCLLLLEPREAAPYLRLLRGATAGTGGVRFAPLPLPDLLARCCPENFGQLADLVESSDQLKALAEDAYVSTVRARASLSGSALKAALPMPHLGHLASSFCLSDAPGLVAANARRRRHPDDPGAADAADSARRRTSKVAAGKRLRASGARGGGGGDRMSEFASGI